MGQLRLVVLVPGACLGGWAWQDVARDLRARGHDVYPVTLTGLGERVHLASPSVDLETHINDVVNLLDYEDLDEVVLVGHSYAGIVITGVEDRSARRLHGCVYLDTSPVPGGMAIYDLQPPQMREQQRRDVDERGEGWWWPVPNRATLAPGTYGSISGLSEAHLRAIEERGTPQPYATFTTPLRLANGGAARAERHAAIFCTANGMTVELARRLIADGDPRAAAFADGDWELHELATGHWPMFSTPQALAELLHEIAATD
jgi:pimeloyl-ACP methyl ester carboxylesterase